MMIQKCGKYLMLIGGGTVIPQLAFAHAGHRGYVMLLPTELFMVGGAVVVALTFAAMIFVTRKSTSGKFLISETSDIEIQPKFWASLLSLLMLLLLVWIGFTGNRDPMKNLLTMTVWVYWWIGLTMATAAFGNIWGIVSPWPALLKLLSKFQKISVFTKRSLENSKRLAYWPATLLFFGFAWLELIHPSPMDPEVLAKYILLYLFITTLGIILFGGKSWLKMGEPFTVFFRMVGWLSPIYWKSSVEKNEEFTQQISIRWPCAGLLRSESLPTGGVAFVLLVLSTVSFDGLSKTFWWLSIVGINPLEFPGRTAMILPNTLGLCSTFLLFLVVFYATQGLASRLNQEVQQTSSFIYSMIPIAFGYHFAHYLPTFLVDIQYAFIALSDPFGVGWNLFGTAEWNVTSSYLTNYDSVVLIWLLQVLSIVLAHVGAVIVSHLLHLHESESLQKSMMGQVPATLLMIGYTVFGLWLLSTPVVS